MRVSEQHVRVCVRASRVGFLRGTDEQDVLTFACLLKRVVQKTHARNEKINLPKNEDWNRKSQ